MTLLSARVCDGMLCECVSVGGGMLCERVEVYCVCVVVSCES